MKKSARWLLALCIFAVTGVFLLQFFWIKNYYYVNKAAFEKEANLIFEDALKKEFKVRCDTIENHVFHEIADTGEFLVSNHYNQHMHTMILCITNKHNLKDKFRFHSDSLENEVGDYEISPAKTALLKKLAHSIRLNDVETYSVYFRTQGLGDYVTKEELKYDFDTARVRPIFTKLLAQQGVNVPYVFYARSKDSIYNKSNFKEHLLSKYPVITRAFLTYKHDQNQHYIRVMFKSPFSYLITKMGLLFAGSLFLIGVIAFSLFYLLKSVLTEKKLSLIKNDFISNITHELKTPIATVSAAVESLADFDVLDDPAKTKRYLTHSKNELQRLSVLVDAILNSTLYENQQFEIKPEKFNVDELMNGIIDQYKFDAGKQVTIHYSNVSLTNELSADKLLFQQVMGNIIDNAIKYAGDSVLINIACSSNNRFFVIGIQDNGIGILKENLPYLFEKFYRVPVGNKHMVKGHGLGLNYVKSIMERHKGWCKVESEYGKGTKVLTAWPI